MKFEEKLIKLRKQKGFSQEELAEKLNVTRQTVSKWELGQSKPEMDKLLEISKLFDVGLDSLTNDDVDDVNVENTKKPAIKKERKFLLYIFIIILVASTITLAIRLGLAYEEKQKQQEGVLNNIFGTFTDIADGVQNEINNQMNNQTNNGFEINDNGVSDIINNVQSEMNKNQFNFPFVNSSGTKATVFVRTTLDSVITSNKTNSDRLITVVYEKTVTTDVDAIKNIKQSLDEWAEYEVSVDYDEDGYVYKITVEGI